MLLIRTALSHAYHADPKIYSVSGPSLPESIHAVHRMGRLRCIKDSGLRSRDTSPSFTGPWRRKHGLFTWLGAAAVPFTCRAIAENRPWKIACRLLRQLRMLLLRENAQRDTVVPVERSTCNGPWAHPHIDCASDDLEGAKCLRWNHPWVYGQSSAEKNVCKWHESEVGIFCPSSP